MKFKDDYRLIPVWFLPLLVIIAFCMIQCSCRTGGVTLSKSSAGKVIVPKTPKEINESHKRLPPPKITLPIVSPKKSGPVVATKSARSAPTLPENKSAEANPVKEIIKGVGETKPFSP